MLQCGCHPGEGRLWLSDSSEPFVEACSRRTRRRRQHGYNREESSDRESMRWTKLPKMVADRGSCRVCLDRHFSSTPPSANGEDEISARVLKAPFIVPLLTTPAPSRSIETLTAIYVAPLCQLIFESFDQKPAETQ